MADQISRIECKQLIFRLKLSQLCFKTLKMFLCMLATSICLIQTSTWPSSVPSSAVTTTEQYSFSGFSTCTFRIVVGSLSNSLYYLYWLNFKKDEI